MPDNKKALTVSIIIPAYNESRHLKACLDSIAAQTIMPDEVIVVDNNSSDDTTVIAKTYAFVTVISESQQGIVWARNAGCNAATKDIIGRIDADTHLPRHWVAYVKRFYHDENHITHALTGGAYFYNMPFQKTGSWILGQIAFRMNRILMGHYITYGSNMALPSYMWRKIRPDTCEDPDIHEDLDLAIHLHRAGFQITYRQKFKVGVVMRRVVTSRAKLWGNLLWWPRTLRRHDRKMWIVGLAGACVLFVLSPIASLAGLLKRN